MTFAYIGGTPAVLGKLFGAAFASGLNLYATIAVLGIAARLGWVTGLPAGLRGLESSIVIGSALLLYAIEFVANRIAHVDSIWDAIHTVIRPAAAALLALAALGGLPWTLRATAAGAAGAVALGAHGTKAGFRMTRNAGRRRAVSGLLGLAEDAAAVLLVLLALVAPVGALVLAAATLLFVALFARPLWRAFLLGLRALAARLRGILRERGWRDVDALPGDLRALVGDRRTGTGPPRVARAAIRGFAPVGDYRNGWVVLLPEAPVFLYRSFFRPRRVALPPLRSATARSNPWADVVDVAAADEHYELFLLKDAPSADLALAELAPAATP